MNTRSKKPTELEPAAAEGVPVDAPDNTAPAISPQAVSRMPRAEDDRLTWEHSPEFSDDQNIAIDDRVAGEAWIPGVSSEPQPRGRARPPIHAEAVAIPVGGGERIEADLHLPEGANGLVVFAHGSGSSRFSSRNRAVAESLHRLGLGTLLLDLLTRNEEAIDVQTAEYRFDIPRLGNRVVLATEWLLGREDLRRHRIGYFGASTGAAAALIAAAERPDSAHAVVARGGRPDLAGPALPRVKAPTLLIVGELDHPVIDMNRDAMARMTQAHVTDMKVVPGASHLFEEPGTMAEVERLAGEWFARYLRA